MEDSERYKTGERAIAPLVAVLVPALVVSVLMVMTAVSSRPREKIVVDIATASPDVDPLVPDEDKPDPVDAPDDPAEPDVQITVDAPTVAPVAEVSALAPVETAADPVAQKPAPAEAVQRITCPVRMPGMASRTAAMRRRFTDGTAGCGDVATESAVMKALRWLKKTQKPNGSWDGNPIANTGLAILAYLAHGEVPSGSREFGPTVQRALDSLLAAQTGDGEEVRFRGADGNEYAFLIATYALAEAYGMTRNPNVKAAALKGLVRIVRNQSPTGGWDYRLNRTSTRDDMSFAGWALQALKAGKMAGLHPEGLDACVKKAMKCLETRNFRNGGFSYTAGGNPTGLTATGCLAMQLLGYGDRPQVKAALDYMREWRPAFDAAKLSATPQGACPQYYCYYAAQCKYQAGMRQGAKPADLRAWQAWNASMKALYPRTIVTLPERIPDADGRPREIGYWRNGDSMGSGDTMATCLCALQLMVYYRYLPTTQAERREAPARPDSVTRNVMRDVCVDVDI